MLKSMNNPRKSVNGKTLAKVAVTIGDNREYASIIDLDESNFDQRISKSPVPILVDFCTSWCGPCRILALVLDEIAKEQGENLKIAKVDVNNSPGFTSRLRIHNIPTLVFFKDGEMKDQVVGLTSKADLISRLKTLN